MPNAEEKVAYMKHLEDICALEPKTPDDRMKICFAANAYTSCLFLLDIGKLPIKDQHKVIKRHMELQAVEMAKLHTTFVHPSYQPTPHLPELKIPNRSHMGPQITEEKLLGFFKNPLNLIGKQFVLRGQKSQDDLYYEVVGASKGKSFCFFEVQFADCVSAVEVELDEMKALLRDSNQIAALQESKWIEATL